MIKCIAYIIIFVKLINSEYIWVFDKISDNNMKNKKIINKLFILVSASISKKTWKNLYYSSLKYLRQI